MTGPPEVTGMTASETASEAMPATGLRAVDDIPDTADGRLLYVVLRRGGNVYVNS